MKKLLSLLSALVLTTGATTGAVSCGVSPDPTPTPGPSGRVVTESDTHVGGYGQLPVSDIGGDFWTGYRTDPNKMDDPDYPNYKDSSNDVQIQKDTGTPLSSYWMPSGHGGYIDKAGKINLANDAFANWDVSKDKDAKFNRATVPLHKRAINPILTNNTQDKTGQVLHVGLMNVNDHTSSFASQGKIGEFDGFNFTNWQYLDYMVSWAGSTGEGLIVPPSADVTDAAHMNGVKSMGVVFLAPSAWGLTKNRAAGFFAKDKAGNYLIVNKLLEVAKYYGFDGWFFNNEGTDVYNTDEVTAIMQQFQKAKLANEATAHMDLIGYANAGLKDQQGQKMFEFNGQKVSDIYMQDFFHGDSEDIKAPLDQINATLPKQEKRTSYSVLSSIKSEDLGKIDQIGNIQYDDYVKNKAGDYYSSLATFGFADSWTNWGRKIASEMEKDPSHQNIATQKLINEINDDLQNKMYTGNNMDPFTNDAQDPNAGTGIAKYISERTPLLDTNFTTNFSKGQGTMFASNGQVVNNNLVWNNRDLSSIAPTYMWHIDNKGGNLMAPRYDYSEAFDGGNSLKIGSWDEFSNYQYNDKGAGNHVDITHHASKIIKGSTSNIDLYAANMPLDKQTFNLTFKASDSSHSHNLTKDANVQLCFTIKDAGGNLRNIITNAQANPLPDTNGWSSISGNITDGSVTTSDHIVKVGVQITGAQTMDDYNLYLGKLSIRDTQKTDTGNASNLNVEWLTPHSDKKDIANARLTWNAASGDVDHYNIYQVINGKKTYLGSTRNNAYFAQNITTVQGEKITLSVDAISEMHPDNNTSTIRSFQF